MIGAAAVLAAARAIGAAAVAPVEVSPGEVERVAGGVGGGGGKRMRSRPMRSPEKQRGPAMLQCSWEQVD